MRAGELEIWVLKKNQWVRDGEKNESGSGIENLGSGMSDRRSECKRMWMGGWLGKLPNAGRGVDRNKARGAGGG